MTFAKESRGSESVVLQFEKMTNTSEMGYTLGQGRYFLTDEEQDLQLGRIIRESKQNSEHIGRLSAECSRIGKRLGEVSNGLIHRPEGVTLNGQALDTQYASHRIDFFPADIDVENLARLTNEYRHALTTKRDLYNQLTQLGFPPDDRLR